MTNKLNCQSHINCLNNSSKADLLLVYHFLGKVYKISLSVRSKAQLSVNT